MTCTQITRTAFLQTPVSDGARPVRSSTRAAIPAANPTIAEPSLAVSAIPEPAVAVAAASVVQAPITAATFLVTASSAAAAAAAPGRPFAASTHDLHGACNMLDTGAAVPRQFPAPLTVELYN